MKKIKNLFKKTKFTLPKLPELTKYILSSDKAPYFYNRSELGEEWVRSHEGPTDESNWLIPKIILMSAFPFDKNLLTGKAKLKKIIDENITVFIRLQTKEEKERFEKYEVHAIKMNRKCEFYFFEVEDGNVPTMEETKKIVKIIIERIKEGKKVLIHCWGGHGRTGTIATCLLSELEPKLNLSEIFKRVQAAHDSRIFTRYNSPERKVQFFHCEEYIGKERNDMKNNYEF